MNRRAEVLLAVGAALALQQPFASSLKRKFRAGLTKDPIDSLLMTVLIGGQLFYKAEKGHNPKVNTLSDALVFVSTSISVGYSDIFPKTEAGKLIATALQTFGPALSAQGLDPAHIASNQHNDEQLETQRQILGKLDAILGALEKSKAAAG